MSVKQRATVKQRAKLLCVAAVVAVGVAGCGGDEGSSESAAGGGGGGEPIKVRTIGSVGSPLSNYPDIPVGAEAAVKALNGAGGVNGRQLEWSFCNTRGDANGALKCAREAVQDNVAAVLGRVDIFAPQSTPLLEKAGIPDIGLVPTGSPTDLSSPISYPLHGGNFGTYSAIPYAMKEDGRSKWVIASIDLPIAFAQFPAVRAAVKDAGLQDLGVIKIPAQGVSDYAPFAQQVKEKGADAVLVVLGPAGIQAFAKAVEQVGVDARLGGTNFSFGEEEAAAIGETAQNFFVASPFPSPRDMEDPGIQRFNEELDAAGVESDPTLRDVAGLNAWLSVHAMAEVAKGIQGEVTPESLTEALKASDPVDLFGITTWEPAKIGTPELGKLGRFPPATYTILGFEGGEYAPTEIDPVEEPLKAGR